jgi:hypothetical protein
MSRVTFASRADGPDLLGQLPRIGADDIADHGQRCTAQPKHAARSIGRPVSDDRRAICDRGWGSSPGASALPWDVQKMISWASVAKCNPVLSENFTRSRLNAAPRGGRIMRMSENFTVP